METTSEDDGTRSPKDADLTKSSRKRSPAPPDVQKRPTQAPYSIRARRLQEPEHGREDSDEKMNEKIATVNALNTDDLPDMVANVQATAQAEFDVLGKEFHYLAQQRQKSELHREEMTRLSQESFDAALEDCKARERCCRELREVNAKFKDAQVQALQDIHFLHESLSSATKPLLAV
eukprot:GEMP01089045.1.p1 GENE.GEMP01089045.1~~GEMP01089045.1.p1  ORF type:complete len:193 (+),score=53.45 GEMP01089045.1:49-579(+)